MRRRRRIESSDFPLYGDEDDGFVRSLRRIKQDFAIARGSSVLYPGSSTHVGVARVFGKEHVIHVDPEEGAVRTLRAAGYLAVQQRVEDYAPAAPADVLVALNSYGSPTAEAIERQVRFGGMIIANNWTSWAHELNQLSSHTRLLAAILPSFNAPEAELVINPEQLRGAVDRGTDTGAPYADALFVFDRR